MNVVMHGVAMLTLLGLGWYRSSLLLMMIPLLGSLMGNERILSMQARTSIQRLAWTESDRVEWQLHDGQEQQGRCVGAIARGAGWVNLEIRTQWPGPRIRIPIPFDSVAPDVHRRLRARCRMAPPRR